MAVKLLTGDCRKILPTMAPGSVQAVITSPPYLWLRDYGVAGQVGLEASVGEYIATMVGIFRQVHRVLADDGVLWLNMGDSYSEAGNGGHQRTRPQSTTGEMADRAVGRARFHGHNPDGDRARRKGERRRAGEGMKPKDLMGVPWELALALRADGWFLRQDIIWAKPNPMPESAADRCTKAHEYLFLLSKSRSYWWDASAMKEPCADDEMRASFRGGAYVGGGAFANGGQGGKSPERGNVKNAARQWIAPRGWDTSKGEGGHGTIHRQGRGNDAPPITPKKSGNLARKQRADHGGPEGKSQHQAHSIPWEGFMRNKRSVWTVATTPTKDAHFATFPPKLIEPCVLSSCPRGGTILDPFGGAGTTGLVAQRHGRNAVLIELNAEYVQIAQRRLKRGK